MKNFQCAAAVLLMTLLAACGGGGGNSDGATPPPPPPPVAANVLFVSDGSNKVVAAFDTLAPAGGSLVAGKILTSDFELGRPAQLDAGRKLLYVMGNGGRVGVFANASTMTGKISPVRTFTLPADAGAAHNRIILDAANDRMYVTINPSPGLYGIAVLDQVSTLQGNVTPARSFVGAVSEPAIAIDTTRGVLYSTEQHYDSGKIYIHTDIGTASGRLQPARVITLAAYVNALAIDTTRDRLYVALGGMGVTVVSGASAAGAINSEVVLQTPVAALPNWSNATALAFDPRNDRLYAASFSHAFILNNASKLGEAGQAVALAMNAGGNAYIGGFTF